MQSYRIGLKLLVDCFLNSLAMASCAIHIYNSVLAPIVASFFCSTLLANLYGTAYPAELSCIQSARNALPKVTTLNKMYRIMVSKSDVQLLASRHCLGDKSL